MGLSSWESVVGRLLLPLFVLFLTISAQAQETVRYSVPLQDLRSHEVLTVQVVFEFGAQFDRVVLESFSYPDLHGKEIFRGRLQGVAYSVFGAMEDLALVPKSVRERVGFFAANIAKRQVGESNFDRFISQSIFTSADKTYVVEYNHVRGVTLVELNKNYLKPFEIDISYTDPDPRNKIYHLGVTVKEESNPLLNRGLGDSQESVRLHILRTTDANEWLFQTLLEELRHSPKHEKVHFALEEILGQTSLHSAIGEISKQSIENFKIVDEFLLKHGQVDPAVTVETVNSRAENLFSALEIRSLLYGLEAQDTWLLKSEPVIRGLNSNSVDILQAQRGLIVFASAVSGTALVERSNAKVSMILDFPRHLDVIGEQGKLIIPTDPQHFEQELRRQQSRGIQGNSGMGLQMLNDALIQRSNSQLAPKSCRDLFSKS